ncbi:MAG TPA: rhomboid family intramembrane serine protease [Vicinamibacterales bacterium]|jgi:membrane associated rhomboid family serine protease
MATPLFALLVLAGAALYFMNPEERQKLIAAGVSWLRRVALEMRDGREPYDELDAILLARTRSIIVTPAVIAVWTLVWLFTPAVGSDGAVSWGANYAPLTTNGEWWRLASYATIPDGLLPLLAAAAAFVAIGMVLERLTGAIAFAGASAAAAVVAGVVSLWTLPATSSTSGASGAVFGAIGLLLAAMVYGYLRQPRLPFSAVAVKRIGAGTALFLIVAASTSQLTAAAAFSALSTGLAIGVVVAGGVVQARARPGRSLAVSAAVAGLAFALALPLRGTIDARPAIARIADVEARTSSDYAKAVNAYTQGRLNARALAQLIEKNILPALDADRARVEGLRGVPREQAPMVATAREYFELRDASWRRRVDGLRGSSMTALRDADRAERAALDAYGRLQLTGGS